ncbi:Ig-like domain-containing protein [Candidatus Thiodictyon syntrophicum]|nr:Ig-like domain-containing protein [Candidatus Thiodictyon syntrophicum]
MSWSWSAPRRALLCWLLLWLLPLAPALAAVQVEVVGPGGRATQTLPDAGGGFDLNLPLTRNAVNNVRVSAVDANGNRAEQSVAITQVSLESVVVSRITSERLAPRQIEALVADGVIALDDPANYNVSVFDIVLTIGNRPVPVSVPIASRIAVPEEIGVETYAIPGGRGDGGGRPNIQDTQIIVFQQSVTVPGQPDISLPGIIVIEGRIKSLKEFFSVRLLLMNTSGIFTLSDVSARIAFPTAGLTSMLPADGVAVFGAILPGNVAEPGQSEREFVVRGDEIGVRPVRVEFGGALTGPGIPEDAPIPFSGSAETSVEVRGPPTLDVQVVHPDRVTAGVPYDLEVKITNTDDIPALYASLDLDMGFDAHLLRCIIDTGGTPACTEIEGADLRNLGHLLPGETATEVFRVLPLKSGEITTCMALADQNLSLRVVVGSLGCLVGEFPSDRVPTDGTPAVSVLPAPNMTGVGVESPVVAFFSEAMNAASLSTGEAGSFNVFDSSGGRLLGLLRLDTLNGKTVVVWGPVIGTLAPNAEYTVVITTAVTDQDGFAMTQEWSSRFTTTGSGDNDLTPPELTLSVAPPVDPNRVIPGQVVQLNAYATDQGSRVARVEARIKDLGVAGALYRLIDQRSVFAGDAPPFLFAIDSAGLTAGHDYQLLVTAYDGAGNSRDATLALLVAPSATPPTISLPVPPTQTLRQGLSLDLTPTAVSAGVRQVAFFLDGATTPFKTVNIAPFQAILSTLGLGLGDHEVRAVAQDGLGQTGEALYPFALAANTDPPTLSFTGVTAGQQVIPGEPLTVTIAVTDPSGIAQTQVYLDAPSLPQPLTVAGTAVRIATAGLSPGAHRLYLVATNGVGVSNDPAAAGSYLEFIVVALPTGAAPAAPTLEAPQPTAANQVRIAGQSVAGARVTLTNLNTGFSTQVAADGSGHFSTLIDAAAGDRIQAQAFDLASSPTPSAPTQVTVPALPTLVSIAVAPVNLSFTSAGAVADLTVTGQYDNGASADLTATAGFASTAPTVATVTTAGRVAAVGSGTAEIVVTAGGREARVPVTVSIVTLQSLQVTPTPIALSFLGETSQLAVTGRYSNGSTQTLTAQASFSSADAAVASVTAGGRITAVGNGATLVYVTAGGLPAVAVPVAVNSTLDTSPTVAILTPATGGQVEPGAVIGVTVRAQDAVGGVTGITVTASGAVTDSRQIVVSPAANDAVRSLSFTVPGNVAIGGTLRLEAAATDTAGHSAPVAVVTLTVVDQTAPTVSITAPAPQTPYNFGDHILVQVTAADAVGVASIRVATTGALTLADQVQVQPAATPASAAFTLTVPPGTPGTELRLLAFASDAAGNEGAAIPVDVILTGADITPPATLATAAASPGTGVVTQVSYQVTDGLTDLAHVELWFRRNGLGTFNRYTGADGTGNGEFPSPGGATGTIAFDATRMGGDGSYEFATVGVDLAGNREPLPADVQGAPMGDSGATATFATGASVLLITSNTEIADAAFDGRNVRVQGATLTLVGDRTFHNVELLNGAVLTHRETTQTEAFGLHVQVWTLSIDATSRLDVVGRGYLGGDRAGLGGTAHTVGFLPGAQSGNGGSYGGLGGHYSGSGSAVSNPVNGNLVNPVDLGSGGGAWGGAGGDGGGRVLLSAINLAVDGAVRVDGGLSSGSASGEGSGGSINLAARTLSGKGTITANGGGTGGANHTGGGGGRVAIRSLDISTLNLAGITAKGGDGYYGDGADGTVYLLAEGQAGGELVLNGQGANSPFTDLIMPPGQTFDAITLQNGARVIVQEPIKLAQTLRLRDNSLLTSPTANEAGLQIEARRVIVESGSAIDVTGRGYLGGDKAGLGGTAHTLGFLAGAESGNGGSHGGLGGHYGGAGGNTTNPVYGDPRRPDRLGSGGGAWGGAGGDGGGSLRIIASEAVIVEGAIRADGGLSSGSASGEGAGGSVWITTSRLAGGGSISANGGGTGGANHTGGGGGRVAIYADYVDGSDAFAGLRAISAWRGRGYYDNTGGSARGSAGTVYLKIGGVEDLIIDDNESTTTAATGTPLPLMGPGLTRAVTADTLTTDGVLPLFPDVLVGLRLNPDLNQAECFTILANDTGSIRVATPNEHGVRFADVAAVGKGYAGDYRYTNLRLRRGGYLEMGDRLTVTDTLRIDEYGLLTHPQTTATYEAVLDLEVGTLEIDATGRIDVTGHGYLGGDRAGLGGTAHTLDLTAGAQSGNGGSYGGLGGHYSGAGGNAANPLYGSLTDPQDLGSGGGSWGGAGGDGGGRVFITAAAIHNAGAIHADGGLSSGSASGEGSGGTVNIRTGTLTGNGLITTNGGTTGGGNHTGGGGGRIAIRYSGTLSLPQVNIQSRGGDGYFGDGGHGTLYLKGAGQTYGDLTIDGLGLVQPTDTVTIPGGLTFDNIVLRNGARVVADAGLRVLGTLSIGANSTLTHSGGLEAGLQIQAARVVVESGGAIDVTGRGYLGGNKSGLGETAHTLGFAAGAQRGHGGSHGGLGASYSGASGNASPVYGDPARPNRLGSGGGAWGGVGGDGGGYVRIQASESVIVEGAIRADGSLSSSSASGEGAGGSVWITTAHLAGAGSISANGGTTNGGNHVGGGGGRVAIDADAVDGTDAFAGLRAISAWRGRGYYDNTRGGAGTVYLKIGGVDELIIDDNDTGVSSPMGTPFSLMGPGVTTAVTADSLTTDGEIPLLTNALVGLRINPDLEQVESFTILANTGTEIVVETPNENGVDFMDVAAVGKGYVGDYRYTNLTLRGAGHLDLGDRLTVTDTLRITEHGLMTHPETTTTYAAMLDIEAGTLTIDATGRIDVTGRGYLGGNKGGLGETAYTLDFTAGAQRGNGGSYGGIGGHYSGADGVTNLVYGSPTDPADLGSGGGAWGGTGGDGGGRVFITAGAIENDGEIHADGSLSTGSASGEGSGGTVNIRTGDLTGSGLITASGGTTGGGSHVGGGGGRIGIRYSGTLSLPGGNIQTRGGDGAYGDGTAGTVHLEVVAP